MGCLKLHIIEDNYLTGIGSSRPLKPNLSSLKNDISCCKPFL